MFCCLWHNERWWYPAMRVHVSEQYQKTGCIIINSLSHYTGCARRRDWQQKKGARISLESHPLSSPNCILSLLYKSFTCKATISRFVSFKKQKHNFIHSIYNKHGDPGHHNRIGHVVTLAILGSNNVFCFHSASALLASKCRVAGRCTS